MRRRTVLTSGALILTGCFAGCTAFDDTEQEGIIPTHVELVNATGESQLFALYVEYDGETIHRADHEVGVGDGDYGEEIKIVEIESPDEPGIVYLQVDVGGQSRTADFDSEYLIEQFGGERVTVQFTLVRRGEQDEPTLTHGARISDYT